MAWQPVEPKHRRGEVDRAGEQIIDSQTSIFEYHTALGVVNNWRTAHGWPLNTFQTTLRSRARKLDSDVLIAQRLKRLASIEAKLKRFPNMKLSQMQDLGGCRAVLRNTSQVLALMVTYVESGEKNPNRHEFVRGFDYIGEPKLDGYRGVHLVYKYKTAAKKYSAFNGLRIEIQLRSQLQHAWATAVETVDTFTGQALKSSVGDKRWARFFALMGSALAMREKTPLVQNTPNKRKDLKADLRQLSSELKVKATLRGWQATLRYLQDEGTDGDVYLLDFDIDEYSIKATGFALQQLEEATNQYLALERLIAQGANRQAVLVRVDSMAALRKAYPSYYLDTSAFIDALDRATD